MEAEQLAEIKRLRAENERLRTALAAVEWEQWQDGKEYCPWCTWDKLSGHAPSCDRQLALGPQP